jgi:hypothetical protein
MSMTDRHDWFAETAEAFIRYLIASAGFEVFGQSEWGADLAFRDRLTNRWVRCEVRSTDCGSDAKQKRVAQLAEIAELEAQVCLHAANVLLVRFYVLQEGMRLVITAGSCPVMHEYKSPELLATWLREQYFVSDLRRHQC